MVKRLMAAAFLVLLAFGPRAAAADPTCSTFDSSNRATSNFAAGDRIVVRGTGFAPHVLALVTFQQETRTADVDRVTTNDLGAFATNPSKSRLPKAVAGGTASIRVLQGASSASCDIQMVATASKRPGGFSRGFYLTWGIILGIGAIGLCISTVRRWQAERLQEEMESIPWRAANEETRSIAVVDDDEDPDDMPLEIVEIDPAEDVRPLLEIETPEDAVEEAGDEPKPATVAVKGEPSDAVTRLRREVKSWRSR